MTGEILRNPASTWAEQARTSVAGARTGTLRTRSCRTPSTETLVSVDVADDGRVRVLLAGTSPAVPALAAGTYAFICEVHPDMKGTITAQ